MIVTLNIQPQQGSGFKHVCKGEAVILGRSKNADVVVSDPEVSRFHARIYEERGAWYVKDLNSRNGTLLNGVKLLEPERLENGALLNIGDNRVTVTMATLKKPASEDHEVSVGDEPAHAQTFYRDATLILKDSTGSLPIISPDLLYKHAKRLRLINEISEALGRPMSLEALLQLILDRVFDLLDPEQGVLFLKREDGSVTPEMSRNRVPNSQPFTYSQRLIEEVIGKGVAVLANDVPDDARFSSSESIVHAGVRALIAAPLLTGGECLGLICLVARIGQKHFTDDDLALLVSLGSVAALRIRNLALMEEAARRLRDDNRLLQAKVNERTAELTAMNQELHRLDAMVRVTNREVTLSRVLETVIEQGLALFQSGGSGLVFFRNKVQEPFTVACSRGYQKWSFDQVSIDEASLSKRYLQDARELAKNSVWLKKAVAGDEKLPPHDLCLMLALRCEQRLHALMVLNIGSDRSTFDISGAEALKRFHEHAEHAFTKAMMLSALEEKNAQILRAQDRLIMQEKMASLGTLTAGIAHEIKNPLNFVTNFAQECAEMSMEVAELISRRKQDYEDDVFGEVEALLHDIGRFSSRIREHAGRADEIVMRMVSYAEKDSGQHERFDLAKLVQECAELVLSGAPTLAEQRDQILRHEHRANLPFLKGNPNQLRRVVVNLVQNAIESILAAQNKRVGKWSPTITTRLEQQQQKLILQIIDNGVGIPAQQLKQVFTPFFTTKSPGPNLGLGLSISYDIVHLEHQGSIRVTSIHGEQTTFTIELPCH